MSLRIKILSAVSIIFALLFAFTSLILISSISIKIKKLETDNVVNDTKRTLNSLRKAEFDLESITYDYSSWNDTVEFVETRNKEFVTNNLGTEEMRNLGVTLILIYDQQGNLIHEMNIDPTSGKELPFAPEVKQLFESGRLLFEEDSDNRNFSGFLETEEEPILLVVNPIYNSNETGEIAGTFVFGQSFDQKRINALNFLLETKIEFIPFGSKGLPDLNVTDMNPIEVVVMDDDLIQGYAIVENIFGEPICVLQISNERTLNQTGRESLRLLLVMLSIAMVSVCGALLFILDSLISKRLSHLSEEVSLIWTQGPDTKNVTVESSDEISAVSQSINELLARLRNNREENQQLEIALNQATEATRLKNEFLSMMSHELRTPLNAIIGYTEILLEDLEEESSDHEDKFMLDKIEYSSKHLLSMINEILDIMKIESGQIQFNHRFFDLHLLLENLHEQTKLMVDKKGISFDLKMEEDVPKYLFGDEDHTHQILSNLLTNAVKFTTEGHVRLNVGWEGSSVLFAVEDTGIGIPESSLEDIFLLFRQVDSSYNRGHDGSGLGLTITKKLVEVHNGEIEVESQVGIGTKFTVLLPFEGGRVEYEKAIASF